MPIGGVGLDLDFESEEREEEKKKHKRSELLMYKATEEQVRSFADGGGESLDGKSWRHINGGNESSIFGQLRRDDNRQTDRDR